MEFNQVLTERRSIMNKLLVVFGLGLAAVGGFVFGGINAKSNMFVEPTHFGWTVFCGTMGGDNKICSCVEGKMIDMAGTRDPEKKGVNMGPLLQEAIKQCK